MPGTVLAVRITAASDIDKISAFVYILVGGGANTWASDGNRGPMRWGEGLWRKRKQGNGAHSGGRGGVWF